MDGMNWRKSSYSNGGEATCIEVGKADGVLIRDTTDRDGVTLSVPAIAWTTFLTSLR